MRILLVTMPVQLLVVADERSPPTPRRGRTPQKERDFRQAFGLAPVFASRNFGRCGIRAPTR